MDHAVSNALARKGELERELQKIDQFLALYKEFSGTLEEHIGSLEPWKEGAHKDQVNRIRAIPSERIGSSPVSRLRRIKPSEVVKVVVRILKEIGHPLTRGEISAALAARDVVLAAEDKPRYVGTIMWRNSDLFENREGEGYWLKGYRVPETEAEKLELRLEDIKI